MEEYIILYRTFEADQNYVICSDIEQAEKTLLSFIKDHQITVEKVFKAKEVNFVLSVDISVEV